MCGIAGILDPVGPDRERLRAMASALVHRGPDDEGYLVDGPLGFAFRRLAILDLEGGNQPLSNEDGSVSVVFNGEIYNFRELREELRVRGHEFRTRTDTETIVHLYEELGERCVVRLRGMFAFALWDSRRGRLLLARDRIGQKPLFFARAGSRFLFASEPKAILAEGSVSARLDPEALHAYMALRFVPSPGTMFAGIRSLPPAHTLVIADGQETIRRYWDLRYLPKWDAREDELADRLDGLLRASVSRHLVADVPIGTFLSGGVDSSQLTALACKETGSGLPAFTIGSHDPEFDEIPHAIEVARLYGTEHHQEIVSPDLMHLVPAMVRHLDMPGDPIAACQYHAARLAHRHVRVAIGGDGGDELFGGYDRYAGFGPVRQYARLPASIRRSLLGPAIGRIPETFGYKSLASRLRWIQELSFHEGGDRYAEATLYFRFGLSFLERLYGPGLRERLEGVDPRSAVIRAFESVDARDDVDRMLHADLTTRLPEHLLILVDRMTMAHSLEGRLPFLDEDVVEFAARLPVKAKVRGRELKVLQRQVAARHLPQSVVRRPKQGFMFPIARWLREDLRAPTEALLRRSSLVRDGLFQAEPIELLLAEHQAGAADHHHRLWMLVNLELWYREYVENRRIETMEQALEGGGPAPAFAGP